MKIISVQSRTTSSLYILFGAILTLFCGYDINAQKNNAVYAELGGNAYYYSLNYERRFSNNLLTRGGIGVADGDFILPLLFGKYFGNGHHHLELDVGLTYINVNHDIGARSQYFATAFLGYRYQNPDKHFLLRIGYTPFYKLYDSYAPFDDHFLIHWAGVSCGFTF